jgi:serine/threonine protein phosphatase PrpC
LSETPVREVKVKFKEIGLHAVMRTDVGRRRTENQDSYGYSVGSSAGLFVVADGMGGARGGGTASAMAVELILNRDQAKLTATALESLIAACNRVEPLLLHSLSKETQASLLTLVIRESIATEEESLFS